jgi:hypothetical protein
MLLIGQGPPPSIGELHSGELVHKGVEKGRLPVATFPHQQKGEVSFSWYLLSSIQE